MSFNSLPRELQHIIILDFLQTPPPPAASTSAPLRLPTIDAHQATVLALVSPSCRAIVSSLLYRHVRVTAPSSLRQLHRTLAQRPDLAELVRGIHLGPEKKLLDQGWPFERSSESELKTSLVDVALLPRWCPPAAAFSITRPRWTCQRLAVEQALQSAMVHLDVEPSKRGFSKIERQIGVRAWAARLIRLQAVLDLFLMEMRRVEDAYCGGLDSDSAKEETMHEHWEDSCQWPACRRYPSLQIVHDEAPSPASSETLVIRRGAQLQHHLNKPGGSADHFDHLLHLTRSTPHTLSLRGPNEWRRVVRDLGGACAEFIDWSLQETAEAGQSQLEPEDVFPSWVDDASCEEEDNVRPDSDDLLHGLEDLIELGRSLLAQTSNVVNLALTSFLFRALPSLKSPQLLRSLVIGPRMRYWDDVLPSGNGLPYEGLVRLRIVGKISKDDADRIAHHLPALRELEWELPNKKVSLLNVYENLHRLQGQSDPASSGSGEPQGASPPAVSSLQASFTARESLGPSTATHFPSVQSSSSPQQRTTRALLHSVVMHGLIGRISAELLPIKLWQAWFHGNPVPGTLHPIKLGLSSETGVECEDAERAEIARSMDLLYGDARTWWDEGRVYATREQ